MILIQAGVEITDTFSTQYIMEKLERAGRLCYQSEPKGDPEAFVRKILALGHHSVIEHVSITAKIVCDRGVSHEIVRHRLCAFSQESTRFCDYTKGQLTFIRPPWCPDIPLGEWSRAETGRFSMKMSAIPGLTPQLVWLRAMSDAEENYKALRANGWTPQQARGILPNDLKTELYITANLREWRHIFTLRTAAPAHPQMRASMLELLQQFQQVLPVIFEDFHEPKIDP